MTNSKPTPFARIALRGEVPRELVWFLPMVNLNPFGAGGLDADFVAAFARRARGGWSLSLRTGAAATITDQGFVCDNAYVAAAFLLSRAVNLREPFLTASEESFATLRKAVALAPSAVNVLIEGETGSGKRSLAELLGRACHGCGELSRVDCAVPSEVARELAVLARGSLARAETVGRTVLLDRVDELHLADQLMLAGAIGEQAVRYFATAKVPLAKAVERGGFSSTLARRFGATLKLPPIRRRREDLAILARHFLRNANPLLEFDDGALAVLRAHRYGGNVRELENLVRRLEIHESGHGARIINAADVSGLLDGPAFMSPDLAKAPPARPSAAAVKPRAHLRLVASGGRLAGGATRV